MAAKSGYLLIMKLIYLLAKISEMSFYSQQVENYRSDPLVYHGGMKVSFVIQLLNAIAKIERSLPKLFLPVLVLHGSPDKLCDIRGSYLLMDTAPSQDKTFKVNLFNFCRIKQLLFLKLCSDSDVLV